jgi:HTH-type transcriptional regulator/antitoxin HigA
MTEKLPAAEVFPPGDWIREALDDRGWTQADLAEILGRPIQLVNELIAGKKIITPDTARGLAQAFEYTTAEFWLNADAAWQLYQNRNRPADPGVSLRARIYSKAPIREMVKRNWIEFSSNPSVLEKTLLDFLEIPSLEVTPSVLPAAARMSTDYKLNPSQWAWLCRARQLGRAAPVSASFDKRSQKRVLEALKLLMADPTEVRHVPRVLAESGIRFLVLEHLAKTRIDGACLWLDKDNPVVVVSLRYGRIDNFWFTLMHEVAHAFNGDGLREEALAIDIDLVGEGRVSRDDKPEHEKRADDFAENALITREDFEDFLVRVGPLFSESGIRNFASLHQVHPGIVVGQLHNRGLHYSKFRALLVGIRDYIAQSALTDGWGHQVPVTN